ncbi:MAG: peptidylprolyl isomerase [Bacteroidales bacterium]|nr:peptidylprolyl isomerase [Bacteroidales bacterium]
MKRLGLILFALIIGQIVFSQQILLTINGNDVTKEEFERIYLKNNNQPNSTDQDIDEYLDLFINFKLKVAEAENLGYDTTTAFLNEFNQYFSQLSEPFFVDTVYQNQLLHQAYNRLKKEVRVSYIIIKSEPTQDTIEAYNKAMLAYNRIKNGENFIDVALDVSESSSVQKDKGDGWYNKVFMMPYNLENFAFEGNIGDVSKPLFANYAYFILKITDIRTVPKRVRASHIYISLPINAPEIDSLTAMKKIDSIKTAFKNGQTFSQVASQFSDDTYSSSHGGDIGWFSTGRMLREFETATFNIKNIGDSVGPIRTAVGFHFIQLTDIEQVGSFNEEKDDLNSSISNNERSMMLQNRVYQNLMKEYNYQFTGNMNDFYTGVDSTIFQGTWTMDNFYYNNNVLFKFSDQEVTYSDFAKYLSENQRISNNANLIQFIDDKFIEFRNEIIKNYEITQLPNKNTGFKYLMQEYHDGLLLFDITNNMVWDKAVKDTVGLRNYFVQNRNKYSQKINIVVYSFSTDKLFAKTVKKISKISNQTDALNNIIKIAEKTGTSDMSGVFKQGDNVTADFVISKMQNNLISNNQIVVVDDVNKKIIILKDNLTYVKGLVTADYQDVLEKKWIAELRTKYSVEINQAVLNDIKSNN